MKMFRKVLQPALVRKKVNLPVRESKQSSWKQMMLFSTSWTAFEMFENCGWDKNEEAVEQEAAAAVSEEEAVQEESENMEEGLKNYTYRGDTVLTKDNFRETMETYLYIRNSSDLYKLEDLPLTENFFNKSIEKFPYIKSDLSKMDEFKVTFWGVGEKPNEMICVCEFIQEKLLFEYSEKRDCYYIVLQIENDQIDSMEITLVEQYNPEY